MLQAALWIIGCAMVLALEHFWLPSSSFVHWYVVIVVWSVFWIGFICPLVIAKRPCSEHLTLYCLLTLLMGKTFSMLQHMDHMEANFVLYVKVGTFDQFEQSEICVLTFSTLGIVMLITQQYLKFSICFMYDPGDFLRQTSPDDLLVEDFHSNLLNQWDFGCCSHLFIGVNRKSHQTGLVHIARRLETHATCSCSQ